MKHAHEHHLAPITNIKRDRAPLHMALRKPDGRTVMLREFSDIMIGTTGSDQAQHIILITLSDKQSTIDPCYSLDPHQARALGTELLKLADGMEQTAADAARDVLDRARKARS